MACVFSINASNVTFIYVIVLFSLLFFGSDILLFVTFIFLSFSLSSAMSCLNSCFQGVIIFKIPFI